MTCMFLNYRLCLGQTEDTVRFASSPSSVSKHKIVSNMYGLYLNIHMLDRLPRALQVLKISCLVTILNLCQAQKRVLAILNLPHGHMVAVWVHRKRAHFYSHLLYPAFWLQFTGDF